MNTTGLKVPAPLIALLLFALPACGGEAESAGDGQSERIVAASPDVEDRDASEAGAVPEEAPAVREAPRTERRDVPSPRRDQAEPEERSEPVSPPDRPLDVEPVTPSDPPELAVPASVIQAGSTFRLAVETTLSTRSHRAGDGFYARVTEEVLAPDGLVLIPEGARVEGRITESRTSAGADDEAVLEIHLESLVLDGRRYPLAATIVETELVAGSRDSGGRTAAKVATGTAAGAMVGRILGRDRRSTVTGAVVGAAAGTAVALATQDGHAVLEEGSVLVVRLDEGVVLAAR